jgi:hypothetical protein
MSQHLHDLLQLAARMAHAEGWDAQKFADKAYAALEPLIVPDHWFPACEINNEGTYKFKYDGQTLRYTDNCFVNQSGWTMWGGQNTHVSKLPETLLACGPKENGPPT